MSVDWRLRGCSDCGNDEMSCECFGSHCDWCHDLAHLAKTEENGDLCENCIDTLLTRCEQCGQEIMEPESYIVTNFKVINGRKRKKQQFFCCDKCARERQEYEFRKEWA